VKQGIGNNTKVVDRRVILKETVLIDSYAERIMTERGSGSWYSHCILGINPGLSTLWYNGNLISALQS